MVVFGYNELKEYVYEDFERFYNMNFNEKQIFLAVLNEYEHGEDFGIVENICIHVFLALAYAEKEFSNNEIKEKLRQLMFYENKSEIKNELGDEYTKFMTDLSDVMFERTDKTSKLFNR